MAGSASAIEIPKAPQQKVEKEVPRKAVPAAGIEDLEKPEPKAMPEVNATPWLGVAGDPVDETLAEQLGIEKGLALRMVVPGSPAADAGLRPHDILAEFNGKELGGQHDLRNAIHGCKPEQEVAYKVIRKGKIQDKKVVLGERPMRFDAPQPRLGGGMPQGQVDELRKRLKELNLPEEQLKRLMQQMGRDMMDPRAPGEAPKAERLGDLMKGGEGDFAFESSVMMKDNRGSVRLRMGKEGKEVDVRDENGKLQYAGPYNDEADKAGIPADILERIDALGIEAGGNGGLKFRIGPTGR